MNIENRVGKVQITNELLEELKEINVFEGFKEIHRQPSMTIHNTTEILFESKHFRNLLIGETIPYYDILLETNKNGVKIIKINERD